MSNLVLVQKAGNRSEMIRNLQTSHLDYDIEYFFNAAPMGFDVQCVHCTMCTSES